MAQKIIVYWRDIPAQITVKIGRKAAKRELPKRFMVAIDQCAMTVGAKDSDAYLAEWRRGAPEQVGDDLEKEADAAVIAIDETYPVEKLKTMIQAEGWNT